MIRGWKSLAVVGALVVGGVIATAGTSQAANPALSRHQRTVAFWTKQRVAQAVPRDFTYHSGKGTLAPTARPGTGSELKGASWINGGEVLKNTGKVLFAMGGSYYVCSASVVDDSVSGRSIILTAAHCVYDEVAKAFATNWVFIPEYDTKPVKLDSAGSFCAQTMYGCWTESATVVASGYANAGGFNDVAIVHDYAFVVVEGGGFNGTTQLDSVVGSHPITFSSVSLGSTMHLFGYPAAQKYKGNDLVYSKGALGTDPNAADLTYKVTSNMTGGSSGGPWFSSFDESTGTGVLSSVNSYGYSGVTAMHGPKLNSETEAMFGLAGTMSVDTIYG
jgi:hypothetical protein